MINKFKRREVKAREVFCIKEISKKEAFNFIKDNHYLGDARFFSVENIGLINKVDGDLVGVASYSLPQGNVTLKGWFGLDNTEKRVLELVRLAVIPALNNSNATSFLLGNSIKILERNGYRAVITLADSSRHVGSIYQVCNFKYYGKTDFKKDFYRADGKINPRGKTKGVKGVWIDRSVKHRYAYVMDDSLEVLYREESRPKIDNISSVECCGGEGIVEDRRSGVYYECPKCFIKKFRNRGLLEVNSYEND